MILKRMPILFLACLLVACQLTVRDLPKVLNEAESTPMLLAQLPKDFTELLASSNATADRLLPLFVAFGEQKGVGIHFEDLSGYQLMGVYTPWNHQIWVHSQMGSEAQLASLVHELGHACSYDATIPQTYHEVIAESIAWLVLDRVKGLDVSKYSIVYLLWMAPSGTRTLVYEHYGSRIQDCADELKTVLKEQS